eukprot:TRINITY_DN7278_c0_g1_i5.p1 TRINITY_DN7278_c0_g1~~TRINITY_DN7278_c0_g1_i5.p1  ORF type:complete len:433 (-),score=115.31 TRINITY_DN7278_c0_g1_i5:447-1745(-)
MIRRPPRSTLSSSSAASDVYKRQVQHGHIYTANPNKGDVSLAQRVWTELAAGQKSGCLENQGHSHVLGQVHAAQAAAWRGLGVQRLARLHAMLGVEVHGSVGAMPSNESCLLHCQHALQCGRQRQVLELLLEARESLSDESTLGYWERVVLAVLHDRALFRGELDRANAIQYEMSGLAHWDHDDQSRVSVHLPRINWLIRARQFDAAIKMALLVTTTGTLTEQMHGFLLAATASQESGNSSGGLLYALRSMTLAHKLEAEMVEAHAVIMAANALLSLGLKDEAFRALDQRMALILGDSPPQVCGAAHLVLAKCHLSAPPQLDRAICSLSRALVCFCELQSFGEMEEVLYLLARAHHANGNRAKRNLASTALRVVQQQAAESRTEQVIWGHVYGNCIDALRIEDQRAMNKEAVLHSSVLEGLVESDASAGVNV